MKKLFLLALPLILLSMNCNKTEGYIFELQYESDFAITPALSPLAGTHIFETTGIPTNIDNYLTTNGMTMEDLERINPGVSFFAGIFANEDFGFIREVSIKVFDPSDPTFEKEIFYNDRIRENASGNVQLIGTLVDAKDFLFLETFGLRIELQLRDFSPYTIDTKLEFSFFAR